MEELWSLDKEQFADLKPVFGWFFQHFAPLCETRLNKKTNPGWSSSSNGQQRRNLRAALSRTAGWTASSSPSRFSVSLPVSLSDCRCRWSTTRARPRPSSPSWWTSRIPQSPSAPPCRFLQKSLVSVRLMILHVMDLVQELKEFCGSFDAGMKGLTLSNSDQVKSKTT